MPTPAQNIDKAIKLIKERGWTKGIYVASDNGPMCLVGALATASLTDSDFDLATLTRFEDESLEIKLIREVLSKRGVTRSPSTWNDAIKRTRAEVIGVLEDARDLYLLRVNVEARTTRSWAA